MEPNDPQLHGPPWGDGPLDLNDPYEGLSFAPEEGTVRGLLLRVIKAGVEEDDQAELDAWTDPIRGSAGWLWCAAWCFRRWLVARARVDGFVHEGRDVTNHVYSNLAPDHGQPEIVVTPDWGIVLYEFTDKTWIAFERSPFYDTAFGGKCQPWCWRQLEAKPDRDDFEDTDIPIEDVTDPRCPPMIRRIHEADATAGEEFLAFYNRLGQPPAGLEPGAGPRPGKAERERTRGGGDGGGGVTEADWQDHLAAPNEPVQPDVQVPAADTAPPSKTVGKASAPDWPCDLCSLPLGNGAVVKLDSGSELHIKCWTASRGEAAPAPPVDPKRDETKGLDFEDESNGNLFDDPEEDREPDERPVNGAERCTLDVSCTNEDCSAHSVLPLQHWPKRPDRRCTDCGRGRARAVPTSRPQGTCTTAEDLKEMPAEIDHWRCESCGHDAVLHCGPKETEVQFYSDGGAIARKHACAKPGCSCTKFVLPIPLRGSVCNKCGHKVPWSVDAPGVVNVCDACGKINSLQVFNDEGKDHEERTETHDGIATEPLGLPDLCTACKTLPAEVMFANQSTRSEHMRVCKACSSIRAISGGRRKTVPV